MDNPLRLRTEAKNEIYELIDKHLRKLPRNPDGTFKENKDFHNNDVDALRHSYVSGIFTQKYNESVADIFGRINEIIPGGGRSSPGGHKEVNMDLWNNSVGRKYGKKAKSGEELFFKLLDALKRGELITDPNDSRKYKGAKIIKRVPDGMVVVIEESDSGENLVFYDIGNGQLLSKTNFVASIKAGNYPAYELRTIRGKETPVSKKDGLNFNNLG